MSASAYVGRIGVLAAAFGVGAAILTGPAVAWADTTASDSAGASSDTEADSPAGASAQNTAPNAANSNSARSRAHARTPRTPATDTGQPTVRSSRTPVRVPDDGDVEVPAAVQRTATARGGNDSPEPAAQRAGGNTPGAAATTPAPPATTGTADADRSAATAVADANRGSAVDTTPRAAAAQADTLTAVPNAAATTSPVTDTATVQSVATPTVQSVATPVGGISAAIADVADKVSSLIDSVVTRLVDGLATTPFGPQVESPANWLLLAAARRQPLAAAATASATGATVSPTLVLDGYNIVATSTEVVEQFTGRWAYWPGQPNMQQGKQDFNLVDPTTKEVLGSFSALVTSGDPTSLGGNYVEMLVTANSGENVGTGAGQIPPVGSLISEFSLGGFGFSYASMPSETGDKVAVKIKTPFGSIPIPLNYDASEGIADHTFDNRPMYLTDGYHIKPTQPDAETITGAIGFLPLFNSIQGTQEFGVFDADGNKTGSFTGNFTTTSDTLGIYTQAIQVVANDGVNVGTGAGQTPPVGTVYNVAYFWSDDNFLIYSSMPESSGASAISLKFSTPGNVIDLGKLPLPFSTFDASHEPAMKALVAPGGQKFVPTSEVIPVGVNGLPPRDVQIQGYQQFEVYDFLGRKIGTVDAQVENQWDAFGVHSKSILVTEVTDGTAGTSPLNIPPVGTVMNFVDFGTGFGFADSTAPLTGNLNLNSWQLVTPIFNIPLLPSIALNTRPAVDYYDPFV